MINISYIRLLNAFESFSNAHLQIKRFASDFPEQVPNFGTEKENYPILFVSPNNTIFDENANQFTVDVYCFDIIEKDRININTILSDTNTILNDVFRWFKDGEIFGIDVITDTPTCTPLNNGLLDYTAGWQMSITFVVDTYGICEIPFNESPVVITEVCDIVYSQYLTCETLADCPVIIDMQALLPTQDQKDAMDNANGPDSTNPFATMADVGGGSLTLAQVLANGNIVNNYAIQDATGNSSLILVSNSNALYYVDATTSNELSLNPTLNSFRFFDGTKLAYITEDAVMTEISHTDLINLTATSVTKNGVEIATINDLPAAQIQSDWTQANNTLLDFIKNKPTIPAAQVNSDWNAVGGVAEILNKPTIPTKTSDLTNDGDDGNPFISLNDLPSNIILYPTTAASDIVGYVKLVQSINDPSYNTVAVDVSTGAITGSAQLVSSLATSANVIVGDPGVFNITTIGQIKRVSGSGTAAFYFEVYKRTIGGVETLIGTSLNTLPVNLSTYVEFSASAIWNDGTFLSTDRIVLKFYGNRIAGGSNPTYNFLFGGSTPVRSLVPIPLTVVPFITLDEVADVTITTPVNNDLLAYESSTSLWKNKSASTLGLAPLASPTFTGTVVLPATTSIGNVSDIEIGYLDGVTSSIQTQIDSKSEKSILLFSSSLNPADSSDYYFSIGYLPATVSPNQKRFKFESGSTTAIKLALQITNLGAASSELVTLNLRNQTTTTDYLIGTFDMSLVVGNTNWLFIFAFSHTINTTDQWTIKMTTPAWVTNPTATVMQFKLYYK
jgi:hypothetical protein